MFEDSLVESRNRLASKSRRWITAGSVGLQCLIAFAIVVVPMVRPEALSFRTIAPALVVPEMKKPPVVVRAVQTVSQTAVSSVVPVLPVEMQRARISFPHAADPELVMGEPQPVNIGSMGDAGSGGGTGLIRLPGSKGSPVRVVSAKRAEPVRVSAGVSSGMLLTAIRPVYPRIAVLARQEGTVVVEATISKTGAIESAHVVSGPAMLQGAAIDAVKVSRYRPFRLNGEPTEVQTTITVVFRLGSGA